MGRGSPLCAKLLERIVRQFKDNVSQCKIAKNLGLSPFTVHNIVKRFRESGEILVRKGQGRKPLLNARDHRALRRYRLRNRHDATMMDHMSTLENHCHSTHLYIDIIFASFDQLVYLICRELASSDAYKSEMSSAIASLLSLLPWSTQFFILYRN